MLRTRNTWKYRMAGGLLAFGSACAQGVTRPVLSAPPPAPTAAPPLPAPQVVVNQSEVDPSYVIGPDDALTVTVWKEANFTGPHTVRPDGKISMPLLGDLTASGMTPMQLSATIADRLKKYVNDPLVTVSMQSINSKHIYLVGEIAHIGPQAMAPGLTPLQAIATAGGLNQFANQKHIYILRKVNGKEVKLPFNYKQALKTGDMQGITLMTGDTIVVP